jgi:hypothetical protein
MMIKNNTVWVCKYRRSGDEDRVDLCTTKNSAELIAKDFLQSILHDLGIIKFNETSNHTLYQLEDMCSDRAYIDIWEQTVITEEELGTKNIQSHFLQSLQNVINNIIDTYSALPSYSESSDYVAVGLLFIFDENKMVFKNSSNTKSFEGEEYDLSNFLHVSISNYKGLLDTIHEFLEIALKHLFKNHTFVIKHDNVSDGIVVDIFKGKSTDEVDFVKFLTFDYLNNSAGWNPIQKPF